MRKKLTFDRLVNDILPHIKPLEKECMVRVFSLKELGDALLWAKFGHISIHENFATKRKGMLHVMSCERDRMLDFCYKLGLNPNDIKYGELFKFYHFNWIIRV